MREKSGWVTTKTHPSEQKVLLRHGLSVPKFNELIGGPKVQEKGPRITVVYAQSVIANLRRRWLAGELKGYEGFTADGWPTVEFGSIPGDGRTSKNFDHFLHRSGSSWSKEVAKQGGPLPRQRQRKSFVEAMACVRANNIRDSAQYVALAKTEPSLPRDPPNYYKNDWTNWRSFLGTERLIPSLKKLLAACDDHRRRTGEFPNSQSDGDILPGWKVRTVDAALRNEIDGWPKGTGGLPGLLHQHREAPLRVYIPLTRETLTTSISTHVKEHPGVSPLSREGLAPGLNIAFHGVSAALKTGRVQGVLKPTSLSLFCKELGYSFRAFYLSRREAEDLCRSFYAKHGRRLTVSDTGVGAEGRLGGKTFDNLFRRGVIKGCRCRTLAAFNDSLGIPNITRRGT